MRRKQMIGTKYDDDLDAKLDANQADLVDALTTPHVQLPENVNCGGHKICSSYPAHQPDAQPTQGEGRIVWNRAYSYQPHGPSYLDPIPDPGLGGGY